MSWQPNNAIYPEYLALKYDPPTIAIFYKTKQFAKKKRVYYILLNDLINLQDPSDITCRLYQEHPMIVNPQNVEFQQLKDIVSNIKKVIGSNENFDRQKQQQFYENQILQQQQQQYDDYLVDNDNIDPYSEQNRNIPVQISPQDRSQIQKNSNLPVQNVTPHEISPLSSQQQSQQKQQQHPKMIVHVTPDQEESLQPNIKITPEEMSQQEPPVSNNQLNLDIKNLKIPKNHSEHEEGNSNTRKGTEDQDEINDISYLSIGSLPAETPDKHSTHTSPQQNSQQAQNPSQFSDERRKKIQQNKALRAKRKRSGGNGQSSMVNSSYYNQAEYIETNTQDDDPNHYIPQAYQSKPQSLSPNKILHPHQSHSLHNNNKSANNSRMNSPSASKSPVKSVHIGDINPIGPFSQNQKQNSSFQDDKNSLLPSKKLKHFLKPQHVKQNSSNIDSTGYMQASQLKVPQQKVPSHSRNSSSPNDLGGGMLDTYFLQNTKELTKNQRQIKRSEDDFSLGSLQQSKALQGLKDFKNEKLGHQFKSSTNI